LKLTPELPRVFAETTQHGSYTAGEIKGFQVLKRQLVIRAIPLAMSTDCAAYLFQLRAREFHLLVLLVSFGCTNRGRIRKNAGELTASSALVKLSDCLARDVNAIRDYNGFQPAALSITPAGRW
jgi:hypothetical protein